MELRRYQNDCLDRILVSLRQVRATLLVAPTGSGKTVMFSEIARRARAKGKHVTILVHRQELIRQTSDKLLKFDVPHGIIWAQQPMTKSQIQVASVQTLSRRLQLLRAPDLIVVDEAHHSVAGSWKRILDAFPSAKVLGVTATPQRTDGGGLNTIYQDMVMGPSVPTLIKEGFLSDYRAFAPPTKINRALFSSRGGDYAKEQLEEAVDKPSITGDAVEHYQRLCPGSKAIVFCVSIEHARHVAADFSRHGISAESVDGSLSDFERARILGGFHAGTVRVLTSCDLINEGFDVPDAETAVLLRPTKSLGLHLQQLGRVLRPGKLRAYIIDHVGNLVLHGLPDTERDWSLEGSKKRAKGEEGDITLRTCPACFATFMPAIKCPECGHEMPHKEREIEHCEGELIELGDREKQMLREERKNEERACKSFDDYVVLGRKRKYNHPELWAAKMIQLKTGYRRKGA